MIALVPLLALASPDRPLPRLGEALESRRYWTVEGDGPVRPKWRNRRGRVQAWTWPDGIIEHYIRYEKGVPVALHRFDAGGRPRTTTALEDGAPVRVTVHGLEDVEVEVGSWTEVRFEGVALRVPGPGRSTAEGLAWDLPHGRLAVRWIDAPAEALTDPAFAADLARACACDVQDRAATWLDSRPAVRFRAWVPHPDAPRTAELWAVPIADRVLLMGLTVAGQDLHAVDPRLATGRAIAALLRFPEDAP
jgi:hypothetical protein